MGWFPFIDRIEMRQRVILAAATQIRHMQEQMMSEFSEFKDQANRAYTEITALVAELRSKVVALEEKIPDSQEVADLKAALQKLDDVVPNVQEGEAGTPLGTDEQPADEGKDS